MLDFFYIIYYISQAIKIGNVPYISDIINAYKLTLSHGDTVSTVAVILVFLCRYQLLYHVSYCFLEHGSLL